VAIEYGEEIELDGTTNTHVFYWTPPDSLSCTACLDPIANPSTTTDYVLNVLDNNGCRNTDTVTVFLDAVLYIPNAFTPDGDGVNDIFLALGKEINTFQLLLFNRWGELIFTSNNINNGWNGRYKGKDSPMDVYVWKIKYSDYVNPEIVNEKIGHVTLIK